MPSRRTRERPIPTETAPFSTLLSQLLVAFTIELDNEFEHHMPHTKTTFGASAMGRGVWLGSWVLWANTMRLVPESGITIRELVQQARTDKLQLPGLERWGYITVTPVKSASGKRSPPLDSVVTPTVMGGRAKELWRPLAAEIEGRWNVCFGPERIRALRASLAAVLTRVDLQLPEFLPILGYGLFSEVIMNEETQRAETAETLDELDLCALLAKVLLAFTIEFEFDSKISLPIAANVLRLLDTKGVRIADLPQLSGIAKEGIAFATGWLDRGGYAELVAVPDGGKGKMVRLTPKGEAAQESYSQRLTLIEARWQEHYGEKAIATLRESLIALLHQKSEQQWVLSEGLTPYPDGWRARKPYEALTLGFIENPAAALPHFPMVLHRGGYPDGS